MEKFVKYWLVLGCVLVLFQIMIGGVTRLTGSGLSITKWEIVLGTFPPVSEKAWNAEFDLYKETPQYEKINKGMELSDFKFIYFWEYFHRLWARMMGLIFLIPFIYLVLTKNINRETIRGLGNVILCAVLAAIFGWIMVASGLIERPWVNAYKLSIHLSLGVAVMATLLWVTFKQFDIPKLLVSSKFRSWTLSLLILIAIQLFLGGIMSGMKAGLFYPTWPEIGDDYFPQILFNNAEWNVDNFVNYDKNQFFPALIHFLHRSVAYLITGLSLYYVFQFLKYQRNRIHTYSAYLFLVLLVTQILLGIITLINCIGSVPVLWGSLHQIVGVLFFSTGLFFIFFLKTVKK